MAYNSVKEKLKVEGNQSTIFSTIFSIQISQLFGLFLQLEERMDCQKSVKGGILTLLRRGSLNSNNYHFEALAVNSGSMDTRTALRRRVGHSSVSGTNLSKFPF